MQAKTKVYSATATGVLGGNDEPVYAPGGTLFNKYAIQVKGVGAGATSWSVTLEGSLDGVNFTTLATHNATDGSTVFAVDKPCLAVRANVGALSLGSATAITVTILAGA